MGDDEEERVICCCRFGWWGDFLLIMFAASEVLLSNVSVALACAGLVVICWSSSVIDPSFLSSSRGRRAFCRLDCWLESRLDGRSSRLGVKVHICKNAFW